MTAKASAGSVTRGRPVGVDVPTPVAVLLWVAILAPFGLQAVRIAGSSWDWISMHTTDDTFYYLEVARRIVDGEGSTFDGINETNGYHPLWMGLTTALAMVFRSERGLVTATLLTGLALAALALVLFVREIDRLAGRGPALAAGVVASSSLSISRWTDGMEGPATLVTLALVAIAVRRSDDEPQSFGRSVAIGLASGLVVLSRLDYLLVIWVVPLLLFLWDRRSGRNPWARVRGVAVGGALLLVPFALWFAGTWGHPVTTSASIKSHWMELYSEEEFGGRLTSGYLRYLGATVEEYWRELAFSLGDRGTTTVGGLVVAVTAMVGAVGIAIGRLRPARSPSSRGDRAGSPVSAECVVGVVVLKAAFDVVLLPPFAVTWYAAATMMVVPLLLGAYAWFGAGGALVVSRLLGAVVFALLAVITVPPDVRDVWSTGDVGADDRNWLSVRDSAAEWILAEGPEGRYAAFDAGLLGYRLHGERELVNIDGLVNDYGFAELVTADAPLDEVVRAEQIDFVVNRLNPARQAAVAGCSEVIWESPRSILAREGLDGEVLDLPVVVLDVRGCRDPGG